MKVMIFPLGAFFMVWFATQAISGNPGAEKKDKKAGINKRQDGVFFHGSDHPGHGEGTVTFRLFPGEDASKKLLSYLSQPDIHTIFFHTSVPARLRLEGEITIPEGKKLSFDGSVVLTGDAVIRGGIIKGPYNRQIFDTTISLENTNVAGKYFPAAWFGLKNDGKPADRVLQRSMAAAGDIIPVFIPVGIYFLAHTLRVTSSLTGAHSGAAILKWSGGNSIGQEEVMMQIDQDSASIKDLTLDGNGRVVWVMEILNNKKHVEISRCIIKGAAQPGGIKTYAVGIRFREGMDNLHIHHCTFSDINAGVTGIARGIIGSGKISPKHVVIENNTFDGITCIGASNWDADQLVIQDYRDSSGMIIRYNRHLNISKRGQKLQSPGICSYKNEFQSSRYKTDSKRSYAAISAYANGITIKENTVSEGVFEKCIEAGVADGRSYNNIRIEGNILQLSASGLGNNDGIRVFGSGNTGLSIRKNFIRNVRQGIWLDCSSRGTIIDSNEVRGCTYNAYCINTVSNTWPDTWNNDIVITNNKAFDIIRSQAFDLRRISGAVITGNRVGNVSSSGLTRSRSDSLTGKIIIDDNTGQ